MGSGSMMNKCVYEQGAKAQHKHCTHQHYCIFNTNRKELETNITQLKHELNEYETIKHCFINGEIIYHEDLSDYYDIEVIKYVDGHGANRLKTSVKVKEGFNETLNRKIRNIRYDLKTLEEFKNGILHGKIGGYGL